MDLLPFDGVGHVVDEEFTGLDARLVDIYDQPEPYLKLVLAESRLHQFDADPLGGDEPKDAQP